MTHLPENRLLYKTKYWVLCVYNTNVSILYVSKIRKYENTEYIKILQGVRMFFLYAMFGFAHANDVLIPHVTGVELADLVVAQEIEQQLTANLENLGVPVVPASTLDKEFPEVATSCFDMDSCPTQMFSRDGATLLLVGSVELTAYSYNIQMRYYGKTSREPLNVQTYTIAPSELKATIQTIAEDASVIYSLIPQTTPTNQVVVVEKQVSNDPQVMIIEKVVEKEFVQPPPTRVILSLPSQYEQDYYDSKLMPDEWLKQRRIRAMNVIVEMQAGLALGDVDRSYDTRLGFYPNAVDVFDIYEYETFKPGTGSMLGGAIGFAPLWWLEFSLYGGVILSQKSFSRGWEVQSLDGQVTQNDEDYDSVIAVTGHIEPRIRLYTLPSGPVKPYALLGAYMRVYDPYIIKDNPPVNYANQPGGWHYGFTTGGGVAFDSAGPVGVFIEVPWSYVMNQEVHKTGNVFNADYQNGLYIKDIPQAPTNTNQVVGINVGMNLRFH